MSTATCRPSCVSEQLDEAVVNGRRPEKKRPPLTPDDTDPEEMNAVVVMQEIAAILQREQQSGTKHCGPAGVKDFLRDELARRFAADPQTGGRAGGLSRRDAPRRAGPGSPRARQRSGVPRRRQLPGACRLRRLLLPKRNDGRRRMNTYHFHSNAQPIGPNTPHFFMLSLACRV